MLRLSAVRRALWSVRSRSAVSIARSTAREDVVEKSHGLARARRGDSERVWSRHRDELRSVLAGSDCRLYEVSALSSLISGSRRVTALPLRSSGSERNSRTFNVKKRETMKAPLE